MHSAVNNIDVPFVTAQAISVPNPPAMEEIIASKVSAREDHCGFDRRPDSATQE